MKDFDILQVNLVIKEKRELNLTFAVCDMASNNINEKVFIGPASIHISRDNELVIFNTVTCKKGYLKESSIDTLCNILDDCISKILQTLVGLANSLDLKSCIDGNKINFGIGRLFYKLQSVVNDSDIMLKLDEIETLDKADMALSILHSI